MQKTNWKRRVGWVLVILGAAVIAVEVITRNSFSGLLGKLLCGERYMVMVDGHIGDGVCGFNADIQTVMGSFLTLLAGLVFLFLGRRKKRIIRRIFPTKLEA